MLRRRQILRAWLGRPAYCGQVTETVSPDLLTGLERNKGLRGPTILLPILLVLRSDFSKFNRKSRIPVLRGLRLGDTWKIRQQGPVRRRAKHRHNGGDPKSRCFFLHALGGARNEI